MGTQQILLIVLSVIIVGAAIAVGIQMFNSQAYSANKSAIAADAQSFATQVVQFYKTPKSQGGAGADLNKDETTLYSASEIGNFLGWTAGKFDNENGDYEITTITENTVVVKGTGKETKGSGESAVHPTITTTVTFPDGTITAVATDA